MKTFNHSLKDADADIHKLIHAEWKRQEYGLEMIASENYVSRAVLETQGSILTNKYAEGYPGKRYYGGCHVVDDIEQLAIDRACQIFEADHANVQPHSGSQANMAVYLATLKPGEKCLGMDLNHGGHLTHGSPVNFSGLLYEAHHYGVREDTHLLDYDQIKDTARKVKPQLIIAGYSAYPRIIDFKIFREIADEVGATLLVDMAHFAGLVAGKAHPSPIPHADFVTTTTHKTLRGPRGGMILCSEKHSKVINSKIFPGMQGGPLEHVIGAKAVAFKEALQPEFATYSKQVIKNAKVLAETLLENGFSLITGGTDNHLVLVDLSRTDITGKDAELILDQAGITVNKNTIPFEKRSPFVTSGIRLGTPALTTRGFKEAEMKTVGEYISAVLSNPKDETISKKMKQTVEDLCKTYPLYNPDLVSNPDS